MLRGSADHCQAEFNISVDPKLIAVQGRVLQGPKVLFSDAKIAQTRGNASWDLRGIQFSAKAMLPSWTYLHLTLPNVLNPFSNKAHLEKTLESLTKVLRSHGITANDFTPGQSVPLNPFNVNEAIDDALKKALGCLKQTPAKLILVILPKKDSSIYDRIKFMCDVKLGVLNVCTVAENIADGSGQFLSNLALKFNLKLLGRNQYLESSKLGIIAEDKTMVVGIDVTHPSPGSASNTPSVAGIVASVDRWLGQWPAELKIQTARQEMVSSLDDMLKSRLRLWAKKHNRLYPENILIYRDGVSEGQYDVVLDNELPLLRKACKELYPANDSKKGLPHMSIIIVGKRHNTRFYPTSQQTADSTSNPCSGTVVDRGVTEALNWDFFLQSHTALHGTARPAHYFVVLDEIFRRQRVQYPNQNAADTLEDLTHNLCYLYGRATKAVSICPPAYYADLVCERARCYLSSLFVEGVPADTAEDSDARPENVEIHPLVRDAMFYI